MANLISSLAAQIKFYNYKVNALCVIGIEATASGKVHLANAVNKEALAVLDYCNSLREAKALLREDKKLKLEISALFDKALALEMKATKFDYLSYNEEDEEDDEPWFGQQPSKQETDLEDNIFFLSSWNLRLNLASSHGKCQSKNKAKWSRTGKATRILSNR